MRLRRTLLAMAVDAMSGPDGLAAYLRTRKLGVPFSGKSLPLDMGKVTGIPDYLRRAVILHYQRRETRHRHNQQVGIMPVMPTSA